MAGDYRKDFEVAMLFHPELHGNEPKFLHQHPNKPGYSNSDAELLYQGYALARDGDAAQLSRFDPGRFIGQGHMTEINGAMAMADLGHVSTAQIRIILSIVKGWPK